MAVENKYVINAKTEGDAYKQNTMFRGGDVVAIVTKEFTVAAADDDGSIYRVGKVNKNLVPVEIWVTHSLITGGSDYDIGLYKTLENGGAVADKDCFDDGSSWASAVTIVAPLNGMTDMTTANIGKEVWQLAGATTENDADLEYDLAITANTIGTVEGEVTVRAIFAKTA